MHSLTTLIHAFCHGKIHPCTWMKYLLLIKSKSIFPRAYPLLITIQMRSLHFITRIYSFWTYLHFIHILKKTHSISYLTYFFHPRWLISFLLFILFFFLSILRFHDGVKVYLHQGNRRFYMVSFTYFINAFFMQVLSKSKYDLKKGWLPRSCILVRLIMHIY